jgi:hypothetical protein
MESGVRAAQAMVGRVFALLRANDWAHEAKNCDEDKAAVQ